jgi:two-component system, cell cycle sensor histidine kinase and response regulator CckA
MKALLVDDNRDNLYFLETLLSGHGYQTASALNGQEALALLAEDHFDLVISDILMPVMDGFALCREIRSKPEFKNLPFIVYTATYTGPQDEELARRIGADRFVIKPAEPDYLLQVVREAASSPVHDITIANGEATGEEILRLYNDRLVRKLEQKMLQAESESLARKQALDALNRSEALLNTTQSIGKIGGWEWNVDTNEWFWTRETYRIHDLDPDDPALNNAELAEISLRCYDEDSRPGVTAAFEACAAEGRSFVLETQITTYKNRRLDILTSGKAVLENDRVCKVIGYIQDITERKQAELEKDELRGQLLQAQKLESIGRLAGGVAHDFNNILTVILGYGEAVLQTLKPDDPLHRDIREIIGAGNRAANLTRQLLIFSRKQVVEYETVNLNRVIRDFQRMLGRLIGEDVEITVCLAPDLGDTLADPSQIEQVLLNLAVNARDAMPSGGRLIVETRNIDLTTDEEALQHSVPKGSYIGLSVTDNGCGMKKETIEHIFEPFFTTKELGRGTGLGLSTVYGIVAQCGGGISVVSQPGKGASFRMLFPRVSSTPKEEKSEPGPIAANKGAGRILLVEDDPPILSLINKMLKRAGFEVSSFGNAVEALWKIQQTDVVPDLIITDVLMPGMNGREFIDNVHVLNPKIKALFISGYTDDVMEQHGVFRKDNYFLEKPFTADELIRKINQILEAKY